MIEPHLAEKATANAPDWQSVLALSPAARTMLETLGIWNRLDQPSGSIWDMQVFGRADAVGQEAGSCRRNWALPMTATRKHKRRWGIL